MENIRFVKTDDDFKEFMEFSFDITDYEQYLKDNFNENTEYSEIGFKPHFVKLIVKRQNSEKTLAINITGYHSYDDIRFGTV